MFGALFFLSIGMLIDYRTLDDFIVPALVVVGVFMAGKVVANAVGSILAGHSPEDAMRVGMTMPQMGEFSLAIGRVSPTDALGGFYPRVRPLHCYGHHLCARPDDLPRSTPVVPFD